MREITKEQIKNELNRFYSEYGRTPRIRDIDKLSFGASTARRRFGSWNKALIAAGLPINHDPKNGIVVNCMECETSIDRTPSHIEKSNGKWFCSVSCSNIWHGRLSRTKCAVCETPTENGNKYCSMDCRLARIGVDETQTLEQYRNGYTTLEFHAKIRGLARVKIQRSDMPYCCKACGYSLHVECCHIKPIADFDSSATLSEVNDLSNLVYLCPNHHWEFDNGHLKLHRQIAQSG